MVEKNNVVNNFWVFLSGKKRNIGLILIGLGFLLDAVTPLIQSYLPFPLNHVSEWLKATGGGFTAVGGADALRKK